jgi:hypothetical protein
MLYLPKPWIRFEDRMWPRLPPALPGFVDEEEHRLPKVWEGEGFSCSYGKAQRKVKGDVSLDVLQ